MAHSRFLERSLFPLAILVKVTPIVAIAPLLAIWFGFGLMPKVFIAALIVFFPVMVNAVVGFRSVNPRALELLAVARRVTLGGLPEAAPAQLAALSLRRLQGIDTAERDRRRRRRMVQRRGGLGRVIQVANSNLDMPTAFGAIVSLAVMGIGLYLITSFLERRLLSWHESTVNP